MNDILRGFKDFISRGNVVELAVAVVIGTAFSKLVEGLVSGVLTPLIALVFGKPDLTAVWAFELNNAKFYPGLALDAGLKFLLTAAAVYFAIVLPMNRLAARRRTEVQPEPAAVAEDVLLLQEIRDLLAARPGATPDAGPGLARPGQPG